MTQQQQKVEVEIEAGMLDRLTDMARIHAIPVAELIALLVIDTIPDAVELVAPLL